MIGYKITKLFQTYRLENHKEINNNNNKNIPIV